MLLLGAEKQGWIDVQVPYAIHYLAAFGPMLAALVVTAATSGKAGLKEVGKDDQMAGGLEVGLFFLPGFIFGVLCGAVIFTWMYNGTGGSVLMVALWHGFFDFFTASKAGQDIIPIVMSALVIVWVLVITNLDRPWNFYHVEKQVL